MHALSPIATVVLPARDAVDVIGVQLAALAAQPEADRLEVLVVDNGSSDGTGAIARTWADQLPGLSVLGAPDRASQAYALNVGVAAAQCDDVLVCDADDRVDVGWAMHLLAALASADSVGGLVVGWDGGSLQARTSGRECFEPRFGFLPAFGGNNAAFTKQVWTEVGGFDEAVGVAQDVDLSWRIQLAGYSLAFAPDALVFGRERTTPRATFRQTYGYGKGQVALYAKHRSAGMPRSSTSGSVRRLGSLLRHLPNVAQGPDLRRAWCASAGWRCGQLTGSVQHRTLSL
jgi:cellulose synthase/poly-beta-1,6-N-acetylglucosamine synthase-like glycosyltransferase